MHQARPPRTASVAGTAAVPTSRTRSWLLGGPNLVVHTRRVELHAKGSAVQCTLLGTPGIRCPGAGALTMRWQTIAAPHMTRSLSWNTNPAGASGTHARNRARRPVSETHRLAISHSSAGPQPRALAPIYQRRMWTGRGRHRGAVHGADRACSVGRVQGPGRSTRVSWYTLTGAMVCVCARAGYSHRRAARVGRGTSARGRRARPAQPRPSTRRRCTRPSCSLSEPTAAPSWPSTVAEAWRARHRT